MFNSSHPPPTPENPAVYAIIWKKNTLQPDRSQMTDNIIRRMRVVYWLDKTTQTALIRSSATQILHCLLGCMLELHFWISHFRFL